MTKKLWCHPDIYPTQNPWGTRGDAALLRDLSGKDSHFYRCLPELVPQAPHKSAAFQDGLGRLGEKYLIVNWKQFLLDPIRWVRNPAFFWLFPMFMRSFAFIDRRYLFLREFLCRRASWVYYEEHKELHNLSAPTVKDLSPIEQSVMMIRLKNLSEDEFNVKTLRACFDKAYASTIIWPVALKSKRLIYDINNKTWSVIYLNRLRNTGDGVALPEVKIPLHITCYAKGMGNEWYERFLAAELSGKDTGELGVISVQSGEERTLVIAPEIYAKYRSKHVKIYDNYKDVAEKRKENLGLILRDFFTPKTGKKNTADYLPDNLSDVLDQAQKVFFSMERNTLILIKYDYLKKKKQELRFRGDNRTTPTKVYYPKRSGDDKVYTVYNLSFPHPNKVIGDRLSTKIITRGKFLYFNPSWEIVSEYSKNVAIRRGRRKFVLLEREKLKKGVIYYKGEYYYRLQLLKEYKARENPLNYYPEFTEVLEQWDRYLPIEFRRHYKQYLVDNAKTFARPGSASLKGVPFDLREDNAIITLLRPKMLKEDKELLLRSCPGRTWLAIKIRGSFLAYRLISEGISDLSRIPHLVFNSRLGKKIEEEQKRRAKERERAAV